MTEASFAIEVENVSKSYRLWNTRRDRLISPIRRLVPPQFSEKWSLNYHEFSALKNISFSICKGESWGFIGVNGSGKSTLLKMISGNLRPSAGRILVDGRTVILDYTSGLHGDLSGKENIYLKATLLGLTRKQIKERYQAIIAFAELGDFINQPVRTYSSGMISRLGFSIVAHVDADIIITDEALAVGDRFFAQKCMRFIGDFLKKGTFLFVSHSMSDVLSFCQQAIWLEKGTIKLIGPASAVTQAYLEKAHSEENSPQQNRAISEGEPVRADVILGPSPLSAPSPSLPSLSLEARNGEEPLVLLRPSFKIDGKENGGAEIVATRLTDEQQKSCNQIIGGELLTLTIDALAQQDLYSPILGFQFLDRLGQILFTDDSYLTAKKEPFLVKRANLFSVKFTFQLPLLSAGDYVIRTFAALANPVEILHVVNNALVIHSVTLGPRHGLVGVPLHSIQFKYKEAVERV